MNMPTATLSNGLVVANFSSPHQFNFEDGTILGACSPNRAKALMLESSEKETYNAGGWTDIQLQFKMSKVIMEAIVNSRCAMGIDIILVPFPVMEALKLENLPVGKMRVIRVKNRVTKEIFCDRFCV